MRAYTKELLIPKKELGLRGLSELRRYYGSCLQAELPPLHRPIRFVVTQTDADNFRCELDLIVAEKEDSRLTNGKSIFDFRKRTHEDTEKFNAVLIIPTGIGAEIGGHCGDGNTVARLMAGACDTLITHPNVVNASDINEMTENTLYVEGSIITRLLMGQVGLQPARSNRVLVLMDKHKEKFFNDEIINAVSSARVTLGLDCDVFEMENIIETVSRYSGSGRAIGEINNLENLFNAVQKYIHDYDAIGLSTFIKVPDHFHEEYFSGASNEMINPWGGIEAILTHSIAEVFNIPCAHSPMMTSSEVSNLELGVVDPRKAPETSSVTYLHCILKGLHRSPRINTSGDGLGLEGISCVIIPDGCIGLPTLACLENDIPVIAVKENRNSMRNNLQELPFKSGKLFIVDNYLEAVGVMVSLRAGVTPSSVRRPMGRTKILGDTVEEQGRQEAPRKIEDGSVFEFLPSKSSLPGPPA